MTSNPPRKASSDGSALLLWGTGSVAMVWLAAFLFNHLVIEVESGIAWGLAHGVAAAALLVGIALLEVRRNTMRLSARWNLGRTRSWLRFHLYGGVVFLLLLFMHSGFRFPVGSLTIILWFLSIYVVLSGLTGLALQRWIPRVLAGLSIEALYDRIPELVSDLRAKAEELVASCDLPLRALYERRCAPTFAGPTRRLSYFVDITGTIQSRLKEFEFLQGFLDAQEREKLHQLEALYRTKLEMDAHFTLQQPLRWWWYLHVPASFLLLGFVAVHLVAVFYY